MEQIQKLSNLSTVSRKRMELMFAESVLVEVKKFHEEGNLMVK